MTERANDVRILVCGDRNYTDRDGLWAVLDGFRRETDGTLTIIEGGARGADQLASEWTEGKLHQGVRHLTFPANWNKYGKAAGPIRNQQMLDEGKPDLVLAFHDDFENSKGTRDMVKRAQKAGVMTRVFDHIPPADTQPSCTEEDA